MEFTKRFNEAYSQYYYNVIRYLCKYVKRIEVAEDLAQDVFLRLFERKYQLEANSKKTKNLLFKTARNYAFDYIKKKQVEEKKYQKMHFDDVVFDKNFYQDIEDSYIEGHIVSTVHDTINTFPENEQEIIVNKIFSNQYDSHIEIRKKISHYFLKKVEQNLRAALRAKLQDYFNSN